jgi:hypothetical protein
MNSLYSFGDTGGESCKDAEGAGRGSAGGRNGGVVVGGVGGVAGGSLAAGTVMAAWHPGH